MRSTLGLAAHPKYTGLVGEEDSRQVAGHVMLAVGSGVQSVLKRGKGTRAANR